MLLDAFGWVAVGGQTNAHVRNSLSEGVRSRREHR